MNLSSLRIQLSTAAVLALTVASANALTVTDVSARQRWPWNSLVDVDFTIGDAAAGEAFAVEMTATYDNGTKTIYAKTFDNEPIAATGDNRFVWNLGADYPDFRAEDLQVSVTATPLSDSTPVYLVVDLSGGTSATKWPIRYTTAAPTMTVGQEDPCKTTELWLRRVKAKNVTSQMGNIGGAAASGGYAGHNCTLTNDYYLGIFPVTGEQLVHMVGSRNQWFTNSLCCATRPADSCGIGATRGTLNFPPRSAAKNPNSPLGKLSSKTGFAFDLPTEWQWEFAMRAGSTASTYPGASTISVTRNASTRNYTVDEGGTAYVDNCQPNDWGFYCIFRNTWEWCLNRAQTIAKDGSYIDPMGDSVGTQYNGDTDKSYRNYKLRGGSSVVYGAVYLNAWNYGPGNSSGTGFRVCLTLD